MQEPVHPENDAARVEVLRRLNILDTPPDVRFDRYTRTSARIFGTPIAVISLVDHARQWFKSAQGISARETPRSVSFCGHAILQDDVFEVANALRDPRFRDNPLVVEEPHIRFYAGAPLATPDGFKLGTLCVIDREPRRLSVEEKNMLRKLAAMVVTEIIDDTDIASGLSNRDALIATGAEKISNRGEDADISVHLFKTADPVSASLDSDNGLPSSTLFAQLLPSFYPTADCIAYLGDNEFCVLIENDGKFDERRAINHLSTAARKLLGVQPGTRAISPFVGIVEMKDSHQTFTDVMRDIDAMFLRRKMQGEPQRTKNSRFMNVLERLRSALH